MSDQPAAFGAGAYVPGEIILQFAAGASEAARAAALSMVGGRAAEVLSGAGPGASGEAMLARVTLGQGVSVEKAVEILSRLPGVSFAEPNWIYSAGAAANDPAYTGGRTWGLYGDQTSPANAFGSQAGEAWSAGFTGSTKVAVGVVDSGVDYTHKDLYLNIWLNQNEIPLAFRGGLADVDGDGLIGFRDLNAAANSAFVSDLNANGRIDAGDLLNDGRWENGVDDDANGYRDDLIGWDFVNNDNDPYDDNNHGTHVAGTIGAVGGDGVGVAGVNWSVQMVALKFLGAGNTGSLSNAVRALDYYTAASRAGSGVDFVATNNSWGGGGYSQSLFDAIVRGGRQDILFVAAAGNGGSDGVGDDIDAAPFYPAAYDTTAQLGFDAVISVASITSSGTLSGFSNFGLRSVDLAAPGSSIYSTLPGGGYGSMSGTSMATPHVTGALALAAAAGGGSAAELRADLLSSVTVTNSLIGRLVTGGRLDITGLLSGQDAGPRQLVAIGSASDDVGARLGPVQTGGATDDAAPGLNLTLSAPLASGQSVALYVDGALAARLQPAATSFTWTAPALGEGQHSFTARVEDAAGQAGAFGPEFRLTVDTTAPVQGAVIESVRDDSGAQVKLLGDGEATADSSPTLQGVLTAPLGAGEALAVYRNGVRVGEAAASGTGWSFTDRPPAGGGYSYTVRVEDAAGNLGPMSGAFTLNVSAAPTAIWGSAGSETIFGTAGDDRISGVAANGGHLGKGSVDKLVGGGGADVFVLGDARGRFYDDGKASSAGTGDYALIEDFGAGDKIQLAGPLNSYFQVGATVGGLASVGLYYDSNQNGAHDSRDELIALVKGVSSLGPAAFV